MNRPNNTEQTNTANPTTAEILAEVERRRTAARRSANRPHGSIIILIDRIIFWLSKHWLAVFNTFSFLYVALPILAPVLMHLGANWPAMIIHTIYKPLCHQMPHRSFFLFGPKLTYTLPELVQWLGTSEELTPAIATFVGNETVGYKMALCQRDIAIYGMIFIAGLAYVLLRRRWKIASLPWWAYIGLGVLPMLLDGGYQLISYAIYIFWPQGPITPRESTPVLRMITGALFGLATVWLAYPLLQETMEEFHENLHQRFGWE
ncbi:MAG: DUF2085 domain-containing protein [Chloroflexota bacterium]|nr:DUF2085 domain-containing protein [Chloroflexota bacterium]